MYLLYLDDAGSIGNTSDKHFVLAGIALFETQVHYLDRSLNELAKGIPSNTGNEFEFHANHMQTGRGAWRRVERSVRRGLIARGLAVADKLQGKWALFGAVIEKASVSPEDASEYAFEEIVRRFDLFLSRMRRKNNTQRGLMILDRSMTETRLQALARDFRSSGHRWGKVRNFVDVPFFVDSRATRAVQYADMVAYALWRKYERDDDEFFKIIESAFDAEGGIRHGLVVKSSQPKEPTP